MAYREIEIVGRREVVAGRDLAEAEAVALWRILRAMQTDADPARYEVRQQTGFERPRLDRGIEF